jgi:hypothetical protein
MVIKYDYGGWESENTIHGAKCAEEGLWWEGWTSRLTVNVLLLTGHPARDIQHSVRNKALRLWTKVRDGDKFLSYSSFGSVWDSGSGKRGNHLYRELKWRKKRVRGRVTESWRNYLSRVYEEQTKTSRRTTRRALSSEIQRKGLSDPVKLMRMANLRKSNTGITFRSRSRKKTGPSYSGSRGRG